MTFCIYLERDGTHHCYNCTALGYKYCGQTKIPAPYTTKVSQGTFLIDIMKKAANEDVDGPFNKYSTTYYGNVGDFVIAMDGVEQVLHSDDFFLFLPFS